MINLHASDQLRQRMAWALSQVLVVSAFGLATRRLETELWTTYYDILVRGAFGSLHDLLREVAASPVMAVYLTFLGNKAYAYAGTFPDENFARELMQLFTVGLVQLHPNGTVATPEVATYDNEDIMDFSRVWTGYDHQPGRGNVEKYKGYWDENYIDPMQLKAAWRDLYPKMALGGSYRALPAIEGSRPAGLRLAGLLRSPCRCLVSQWAIPTRSAPRSRQRPSCARAHVTSSWAATRARGPKRTTVHRSPRGSLQPPPRLRSTKRCARLRRGAVRAPTGQNCASPPI